MEGARWLEKNSKKGIDWKYRISLVFVGGGRGAQAIPKNNSSHSVVKIVKFNSVQFNFIRILKKNTTLIL